MATLTDRKLVDEIIQNNGYDPDEPDSPLWFVKIVEYLSADNKIQWGCVYNVEVAQGIGDRYEQPSEYIKVPRVIWERQSE